MLYVLDTDHLSLLQRRNTVVQNNVLSVPREQRATTIISFVEQFLGWWNAIQRGRNELHSARNFQHLQETIHLFNSLPVLSYDSDAVAVFERLRRAKIRIGKQDLRIASIALTNNATVVTRNIRDFGRIPELKVIDWSI